MNDFRMVECRGGNWFFLELFRGTEQEARDRAAELEAKSGNCTAAYAPPLYGFERVQ